MIDVIKDASIPPYSTQADIAYVTYRFTCKDIKSCGCPSAFKVTYLRRSGPKHITIEFKYPPEVYPPDGYLNLCQTNYTEAVSNLQILEHYINLLMLAILLLGEQVHA